MPPSSRQMENSDLSLDIARLLAHAVTVELKELDCVVAVGRFDGAYPQRDGSAVVVRTRSRK